MKDEAVYCKLLGGQNINFVSHGVGCRYQDRIIFIYCREIARATPHVISRVARYQ